MGTPYHQTDESAVETVRNYRNDNGHDSYHDALMSMALNSSDLDDDERSAFDHIMHNNTLHYKLINTPRKQVTSWTVKIYWSDGLAEERTDAPDVAYMNQWINELEEERDNEL